MIVGAGHNGLTCAAYLARAGKKVLVFERRPEVGGACTLEHPFADSAHIVSPCAYAIGLLHPVVIDELQLRRRGFLVHIIDPHLWCPFEDGTALTLWDDDERSAASIASLPGIAGNEPAGYVAYSQLFGRIRRALRSPRRDTWAGDSPERAEIEELLGHDQQAIDVVFNAAITDVIEEHMSDERLHSALHGQGIIGTYAGPRQPGTAAVHAMHTMGSINGKGGAWGYVQGGMGQVSLALAGAGREAGAEIVTGVAVSAIVPGEGVRLEAGEFVAAACVVSNADPKATLALCDGEVPAAFEAQVRNWRTDSPVMKVNCALSRLPEFTAGAGAGHLPHRAMVTITTGVDATQAAYESSRRGQPSPEWCELYFHTAYDPSIAPPGKHSMSVFAQYAPGVLASGDWDSRRDELGDLVLAAISRFAPDVAGVVEHRQVLGPPDIEARMGLTGGHIFQGECLPDQMWNRRFSARTPVPGLYLCGAATHPGGSVMAINGRNTAMAVIADQQSTPAPARLPFRT